MEGKIQGVDRSIAQAVQCSAFPLLARSHGQEAMFNGEKRGARIASEQHHCVVVYRAMFDVSKW